MDKSRKEIIEAVAELLTAVSCDDYDEKSVEEDEEEGAEHEADEHDITKVKAKEMAAEHEEEHPMYYDKLNKAGLGEKVKDMVSKKKSKST